MFPADSQSLCQAAFVVVIALSAGGCGGKAQDAPPDVHGDAGALFGSGTRLKAHYLDGGSGARAWRAFHDTELDIECNFVETSAGEYWCLPTQSTISFSDAACSQPTYPVQAGCPNKPILTRGALLTVASKDCGALYGAFSLDAQEADDRGFLALSSECRESSRPAPALVWTMKAEPLKRFVRGTVSDVGASDATQARRVTANDGAFVNVGLSAAGERCAPFGDLGRCVPGALTRRSKTVYVDASCSDGTEAAETFLQASSECLGIEPRYLVDGTPEDCKSDGTVRALGDELTAPFTRTNGCSSSAMEPPTGAEGISFYSIADRVSDDAFPICHATTLGTGALTVGAFTDGVGVPLLYAPARNTVAIFDDFGAAAWSLRDGTPCQILIDPSGQLRCVNDWLISNVGALFSDRNCEQRVYSYQTSCRTPKPQFIVDGLGFCSSTFDQIRVAQDYLGPVYSRQTGKCLPYDPGDEAADDRFLSVGEPVTADRFPIVVDTIDQ